MTGEPHESRSWWYEIPPGDDVVLAVEGACADRGIDVAWVRLSGVVSSARVVVDGPDGDVTAWDAAAPATLVSCDGLVAARGGSLRLTLSGVLASAMSGAPSFAAGRIARATAVAVNAWISLPADEHAAPPSRAAAPVDRASLPPRATPTHPIAPATAPAAGGAGWGRVAAASDRAREDDSALEEVDTDELSRGDILIHPKLGNCRVLGVVSDDAVRVQVPSGSPRKLMMRVFKMFREGDGRYRLELKGR